MCVYDVYEAIRVLSSSRVLEPLLHLRTMLLLTTFSFEYITRFEPEGPPTIWSMSFA
jgi:hypothetical protein